MMKMGEKEKDIQFPDGEVRNGYTRYAAEVLLPLLAELNGELIGVKAATTQDDIEYVHQSRVASRRIRAALPFFAGCFERKTVQNWIRSVRNITRSLGQARDLDVQIEFLTAFIDTHTARDALIPLFTSDPQDTVLIESELMNAASPSLPAFTSSIEPFSDNPVDSILESNNLPGKIHGWLRERKQISMQQHDHAPRVCLQALSHFEHPKTHNRPGLECLLLRLEQQRETIQPNVIDAVTAFDQSKTLQAVQKYLLNHLTKHQNTPYPNAIYADAESAILYQIQSLCWYAPAVPDARKKSMHHEMRIAAKRLRYTLEACNKLYDKNLSGSIKRVKGLQTLLGDLHDCDVWIDLIPSVLESEKKRTMDYFGNDAFFSVIRPGILFLLENRMKERERIHAEFVEYWEKLVNDDFFEVLKKQAQEPLLSHKLNSTDIDLLLNEEKQNCTSSKKEEILDTSPDDNSDNGEEYCQETQEEEIIQSDVSSLPSSPPSPPSQPSQPSQPHHLLYNDNSIIALIGDVHANLPALNAVLANAEERGVTTIFNTGDLVGYGPYPEEVIRVLRSRGVISIAGNYDRSLCSEWWMSKEQEGEASDMGWDTDSEESVIFQLKRDVSKWTYDALSPDSREYLAYLPEQIRKTVYNRKFLLVHGSPSSITEYITSETPKTRLLEIANSSNAHIIVSGHAHMPFVGEVNQVHFINTGSVGRSEDGDPRACYALLSCTSENKLVVEHIRVPYDINETISKMEQCKLPELYIRAIREGRSPDLLPDRDENKQTELPDSYENYDEGDPHFFKNQSEDVYGSFGVGNSYSSIYGKMKKRNNEF